MGQGQKIDLWRIELARFDWENFARASHHSVCAALEDLLANDNDLDTPYWKLENNVVVQGMLYEAAEPCTCVLIAALASEISKRQRTMVLELLFQIVHGHERNEDPVSGIVVRCRNQASKGLWLLYSHIDSPHREAVIEILEVLEEESARLQYFSSAVVRPLRCENDPQHGL